MRIFVVVVALVLLSVVFVGKELANPVIVCYYYNGDHTNIVESGIRDWNFLPNVRFSRSSEQKFSTLKIVEVASNQMANPSAFGEYSYCSNTVRLNANKQLTKRQWIAIVSHEIGHYFLLQHSKDNTSIMSNNI